jgi:hypothetical protein
MKAEYRKALKIMVLLLTSMLISFVSAATYSELYMKATPITISGAQLKFTLGANTTDIGTINSAGTEVTFTGMTVNVSETKTYEQAVNITNYGSGTKTINLTLSSLTGPFSANFEFINITILDENEDQQGNMIRITPYAGQNVTSTGNIQMPGGNTEWTVKWVIKAKTDASEGAEVNVILILRVE